MSIISERKRRDYTKIPDEDIPAIYFDDRPINAISFVETKDITYPGVKEGKYIADTEGNVFNSSGKLIKPRLINSGYYAYALVTGLKVPKYKNILAHRLIKSTFDPIENSDEYTVNHINMNRSKNNIENLEWVTQKENNDKKNTVKSNDGINNYHAKFSHEQLVYIVTCLDNTSMTYKEILTNLGFINITDNDCDSIGCINRGITYKQEVEEIRNSEFND